jgi:uncharacterized protein (DUF1778 family)
MAEALRCEDLPVPARRRADARIEFRPTADQKRRFEQAAALQGRSLSEFLLNCAEETATRILREFEIAELGDQARAAFLDALVNVPPPNAKLRRAAEHYESEVESR